MVSGFSLARFVVGAGEFDGTRSWLKRKILLNVAWPFQEVTATFCVFSCQKDLFFLGVSVIGVIMFVN